MAHGKPDSGITFSRLKEYAHESNLIEGIDSEEADKDAQKAWNDLLGRTAKGRALTNQTIQALQDDLTRSQEMPFFWRGVYRDRNRIKVQVGGYEATKPEHVSRAMDEWLNKHDERTPQENHIAFEKIHPFADGNGRTGRMLMWLQEYRTGQRPTLIRFQDRDEYYKWFDEEETGGGES